MFEQLNPNMALSGLSMTDSVFLTKEEYTAQNNAVIEVPEETFTMLDLFPTQLVESSKKYFEYTTLSKYGTAAIADKPSDFPALTLDGDSANVRIPMKGISYTIQKDDILNSRKLGGKLDTEYARIAGERVKKLQDEALYSKTSAFGTLGASAQATGSFSGTTWSTNTTDVFDQVRQWLAAVPVVYQQEANRMVIHANEWSDLFRSNWNNGTVNEQVSGGTFMAKIRNAYPSLVIVKSQWATTSTGLLFPFSAQVVKRIIAITLRSIDIREDYIELTRAAIGKDVLVAFAPTALVAATGI